MAPPPLRDDPILYCSAIHIIPRSRGNIPVLTPRAIVPPSDHEFPAREERLRTGSPYRCSCSAPYRSRRARLIQAVWDGDALWLEAPLTHFSCIGNAFRQLRRNLRGVTPPLSPSQGVENAMVSGLIQAAEDVVPSRLIRLVNNTKVRPWINTGTTLTVRTSSRNRALKPVPRLNSLSYTLTSHGCGGTYTNQHECAWVCDFDTVVASCYFFQPEDY